ncbi:MAG: methyl-accepting chemotaxis protein [Chitinophagales bacterium]
MKKKKRGGITPSKLNSHYSGVFYHRLYIKGVAEIIIVSDFEEFVAAFRKIMPHLKEIMGKDMALNISDTEYFIDYCGANGFDLPVQPGAKIPVDDPMTATIKSGQQLVAPVPAHVYGTPMKAVMTPIKDNNGVVVGCIGIGKSMVIESEVMQLSHNLASSMQQIASAIQQIAASASDINCNEQSLNEMISGISEASTKIHGVLDLIKDIAGQTKMLGLNAAIEAARAGESGRGFGVVAEEIRKLSDVSKSTAEQIRLLTHEIEEIIKVTLQASENTLKASEEQAAATEEITASIQEITSLSDQLEQISGEM